MTIKMNNNDHYLTMAISGKVVYYTYSIDYLFLIQKIFCQVSGSSRG